MSVIIICGSRTWTNETIIENYLDTVPKDTIIVHGAARGADRIAGKVAKRLGFEVREYPAQWEQFGLRAGPMRNIQMLEVEHPRRVVAFRMDGVSKGTDHMLTSAHRYHVPTTTFHLMADGSLKRSDAEIDKATIQPKLPIPEVLAEQVQKAKNVWDQYLEKHGLTRKDLTKGKAKK
jgi:hypothetical protein